MSRKRKQPPSQSTTLLSFFTSGTSSVTTKNKNRKFAGTVKKESNPYPLALSQEIIVIESDEEVEAQLDDSSSDIEILEEAKFQERRVTVGSACRQGANGGASLAKRCKSQLDATMSESKDDENVFVSESSTSSIPTLSKTSEHTQDGAKSSALTNDSDISEFHQRSCLKSPSRELAYFALDVDPQLSPTECYPLHLEDEERELDTFTDIPNGWNAVTGDFELDLSGQNHPEEYYRDDCPSKAECEEEVDKGFKSCPICGVKLMDCNSLSVQEHVNACLDTGGTPSHQSAGSSSSKAIHSLSSLIHASPSISVTAKGPSKLKPEDTDAFSVLMSSLNEGAAWEEAQVHEDRSFKPTKSNRRKAPFYKVLQGMPIAVDAFRYGDIPSITAYFLTHAHSDHYTNLSSSWKNGPIYCSETTANLIVHMLSVDRKWICPLPMDVPTEIPNTGGVKVTLMDANHCPGSCLFLFEGPQTVNAGDSAFKSPFVGSKREFRYLHCGDFRACPRHALHPSVHGKPIDTVYLDTTYLNPRYCFPPQPLVVAACAELARRLVRGESLVTGDVSGDRTAVAPAKGSIQGWAKFEGNNIKGKRKAEGEGNVLIVVGTYSIGKERIVKAIAQALGTKIYCDARKSAILRCQDDPELHALMSNDPLEAGVHVVPLGMVASDRFKDYVGRWKGRWTRAVAFRPTGWTYAPPAGSDLSPSVPSVIARAQARCFSHEHLRPARNSGTQLAQYGVPYSEHSSFAELTCFALSVDWARIIATVNVGNAAGRGKMEKWVERWDAERKRRREAGSTGVVEFRTEDYW
ncbi:hypothetical protein M0805_005734 [Coniferiporia weirii]|nr:hypothetical protein M0805_005734 [Coniferiporia weirii]